MATKTVFALAATLVAVEAYEPGVGVCGPNPFNTSDVFTPETPCGHPDQGPRYLCPAKFEYCSFYHPDGKLHKGLGYCCPTYGGNYPSADIQCEKFSNTSCALCVKTHSYGSDPYTCVWDGYNCMDKSIAPDGLGIDRVKYPNYKVIKDNRLCDGDVDYYQAFGDTYNILKFNGTCARRCGEEGWAKFGLTEEEFNERCGAGTGGASIDMAMANLVLDSVFNLGRMSANSGFLPSSFAPPLSLFNQGGASSYGNNYQGMGSMGMGYNPMLAGPQYGGMLQMSPYQRQFTPYGYQGYNPNPYGSLQQPYGTNGGGNAFSVYAFQNAVLNALTFGGTRPIDTSVVQADGTVDFGFGGGGGTAFGAVCTEENQCSCTEDCAVNGECCEDHKELCYTGNF